MRWLVGIGSISLSLVSSVAGAQSAPAAAPAGPPLAPAAAPAAAPNATAPAPTAEPGTAPPTTAPAEPVPPPPPPAAPPPPPPQSGVVAPLSEPPPPPPRATDTRPIRKQRPFFIGGELGWNGLAGLGVNFSYHPIPYLAIDTGLGLSLAGWRAGARVRGNLLTGEWTPVLGAGVTYSAGTGGEEIEVQSQSQDEKAQIEILGSPYLQVVGGVNYTGDEGFVFMATTGYAVLLDSPNTRFKEGSEEAYDDNVGLFKGGLVLSVAFGYAF